MMKAMRPRVAVAINLLFGAASWLALPVYAQSEHAGASQALPQPNPIAKKAAPCSRVSAGQSGDEDLRPAQPDDGYCIDIKGDLIEVKEFVASALQEKGWSPLPPHLPDRLSLSKRVEPEELRHIAVTQIAGGNIHWTEGRVDLTLAFESRGKGNTEVRLFLNILGRGNTSLPIMRPSDLWPLTSTGRLEHDVLAGMEAGWEEKKRTPAAAGVRKP